MAVPEDLPAYLHALYELLGKQAPDFTLNSVDGASISLQELREQHKVVVLQFWATWCFPCQIEALIYKQMLERFGGDGLVIVALHANEPSAEMIPEIRARLGMDYPVAVATDAIWTAYGEPPVLPTSVVIGRSGRVRAIDMGVRWVDEVAPLFGKLIAESPEDAAQASVGDADFHWGRRGGGPTPMGTAGDRAGARPTW